MSIYFSVVLICFLHRQNLLIIFILYEPVTFTVMGIQEAITSSGIAQGSNA